MVISLEPHKETEKKYRPEQRFREKASEDSQVSKLKDAGLTTSDKEIPLLSCPWDPLCSSPGPCCTGKDPPPPIPAREFCQTRQRCAGQKTEPSNTQGYRWNHVPPKRYGEAPSPTTSQRILIWKSGLCRRNQVNRNIPLGLPCWKPRTCHLNPGHPPWTAIRAEAGTGY